MYETESQSCFLLPLEYPTMGKENSENQVFTSYTHTLSLGLFFISLHDHQTDLFVYRIYVHDICIFPRICKWWL